MQEYIYHISTYHPSHPPTHRSGSRIWAPIPRSGSSWPQFWWHEEDCGYREETAVHTPWVAPGRGEGLDHMSLLEIHVISYWLLHLLLTLLFGAQHACAHTHTHTHTLTATEEPHSGVTWVLESQERCPPTRCLPQEETGQTVSRRQTGLWESHWITFNNKQSVLLLIQAFFSKLNSYFFISSKLIIASQFHFFLVPATIIIVISMQQNFHVMLLVIIRFIVWEGATNPSLDSSQVNETLIEVWLLNVLSFTKHVTCSGPITHYCSNYNTIIICELQYQTWH